MLQSYKIAIAGIGGVGAFYGGHLAKTYKNSNSVSVNFVARGSHMQAIRQNGLQLNRDSGTIISFPHHITDNVNELGQLDLIVFCCKAYDLEDFALSFSGNINKDTILLPLLNGVNSTETLKRLFPDNRVLYGCTYLVAKKVSDGMINIMGDLNQLLFGNPEIDNKEIEKIAAIFKATGVNVSTHDNIRLKLWEKYSFISPTATATSALNNSISDILGNDEWKLVLQKLMEEIVLLSQRENINLSDDIIDTNFSKLHKLPNGATSSMHNDFRNDKRTELEILTGYVVKQAKKLGVNTPMYDKLYAQLKDKSTTP